MRVGEITAEEVQFGEEIGNGAESTVYKAVWNGEDCAVRKPKITDSVAMLRYDAELALLKRLHHENVCGLLAYADRAPSYFCVFPLMSRGNLASLLHEERKTLPWKARLHLILQFAYGVRYLHEQANVVHKDLKSSNLLLDDKFHLRISDFGLAGDVNEVEGGKAAERLRNGSSRGLEGTRYKRVVGTLVTMAPEILKGAEPSRATDMYSFGVTINEIATGKVPFSDCFTEDVQMHTVLEQTFSKHALTKAISKDDLRPHIASDLAGCDDVPPSLSTLAQLCWDKDASKRPTIGRAITMLEDMWRSTVDIEGGRSEQKEGGGEPELDSVRKYVIDESMLIAAGVNLKEAPVLYDEKDIKKVKRARRHESDSGGGGAENGEGGEGEKKKSKVEQAANGESSSAETSRHGVASFSGSKGERLRAMRKITFASFDTAGRRGEDKMEDRLLTLARVGGHEAGESYLFAMMDGHGGESAAAFVKAMLEQEFVNAWERQDDPSHALRDAFVRMDEVYCDRVRQGYVKKPSGTTALAVYIEDGVLYIANAGDCRAVLCTADGGFKQLNNDHVAGNEKEREMIISNGGSVKKTDTWRVNGAIQITRSIGDEQHKPPLTAEPEVHTHKLTDNDDYLLLATDGVWDVMSAADVVKSLHSTVKEPYMCAKKIVMDAYQRGSDDNISMIVVFLKEKSTCERVY